PSEAIGSEQERLTFAVDFDGWGYLHLYDAQAVTGAAASGTDPVKLPAIDHWALSESLDPTKAVGFGDLSIHEVAMDPDANVAYSSHYAGGFRVFAFDRTNGIREVGAFIDEGGSNFWGVEVLQHPTAGKIVLASDRDAGLYIFGPARPDLTVRSADITASSSRIVRGRPVTLTAVIRNIGQADAENVVVKFREHRKVIGEHQTIESIPAGGTGTASVTWTPQTLGARTITVVVDPGRDIAESRENNQRATKTFTVRRG
ncbi:MAG TPA: CARDB domain-containing protein, partial [Actinomycetota bacterium]|nr:CARDB domain-containing protein [Actinomycetota bacterium]